MHSNSIAVIGAGSWGTALAQLLAGNGFDISLWAYEPELSSIISETRENTYFLPGIELSPKIKPTSDLPTAVRNNDTILLVVPTHAIRTTLDLIKGFIKPGALIINASKGIEEDSLQLIHQIVQHTLPGPMDIAVFSGPTFASEVAKSMPSAAVAASESEGIALRVQELFSNSWFKVFTSTDLIGVELGGALKNVIAIATGIADGLNLGFNARAALITRGSVEIKRIGTALGARPETFSGLSGMGDLVLTCTGDLSRNRSVGIKLGQGQSLQEITQGMKMVAEGIRTVKSAFRLKQDLGIQASIIEETYRVLHENKSPQQALKDLMKVEITSEFTGVKGLE